MITKAEMETLTKIDGKILPLQRLEDGRGITRGIKSVEGLQYAVNLTSIDLSENEIVDISPIKNLKGLTYLELDRNNISDISSLSELTRLEHLNIYNNAGIVDLTPISKITSLKWIDMHYCNRRTKPVNVEKLSELINLEFLSIDDDFVRDLSFLKNLTKLSTFSCNNNYVLDISPVQDLACAAYNDWSGGKFFNMYAQMLDEDKVFSVASEGEVIRIKNPVVGCEKYVEKINEYLKESGEDVIAPALDISEENLDFITIKFDYSKNEIVITVKANDTTESRQKKVLLVLDYAMYSLKINISIDQCGLKTL
ncbi:leucine-rich repeat domain-containing protein [Hathewaya proteolytica]|nr:leucine-rich repeat domain-containing protein [Hathewaya proteolytica]